MTNNFVFIDSTTDYPYKFSAGNTKIELLAKGLINLGDTITVINSPFIGNDTVSENKRDVHNNIVCYTFRKRKSLFGLIDGYKSISKILKQTYNFSAHNFIIISDPPYFFIYLLNIFFAKRSGYKVGVLFHEWHIAVDSISKKQKLGFYLFDHFFGYFCDFILPISTFLEKKVLKFKIPILKIPILADYNIASKRDYDKISINQPPYFVYCAGAQYINIIRVLIAHFSLLPANSNVNLILVLYGNANYFEMVEKVIKNHNLEARIKIVTALPYNELFKLFEHALALLIPLSNTIQDKARFSQKIAEYLSSGRPVITTNIGEIPYYFTDGVDALIASDFEDESYYAKLKFVLENKLIASQIGKNGFELGLKNFDNKVVAKELHDFLKIIK